jgi:hypothetical protein
VQDWALLRENMGWGWGIALKNTRAMKLGSDLRDKSEVSRDKPALSFCETCLGCVHEPHPLICSYKPLAFQRTLGAALGYWTLLYGFISF